MSELGQKLPSAPPPIYVRSWGNPDVISTKADIDTHAAWLADRNWPTLSRIGPHRRRAGAAWGYLRPNDSECPWRGVGASASLPSATSVPRPHLKSGWALPWPPSLR